MRHSSPPGGHVENSDMWNETVAARSDDSLPGTILTERFRPTASARRAGRHRDHRGPPGGHPADAGGHPPRPLRPPDLVVPSLRHRGLRRPLRGLPALEPDDGALRTWM